MAKQSSFFGNYVAVKNCIHMQIILVYLNQTLLFVVFEFARDSIRSNWMFENINIEV